MPAWKPSTRVVAIKGNSFHQVDWYEGGKRHRRTFAVRAEMDGFIRSHREELRAVEELHRVEKRNHAVVRLSNLGPGERAAVADALAILTKAGGTAAHLVEAARDFARTRLAFTGARSIEDVLRDFMDGKRQSGKRPRTVEGYRKLLQPVAAHFTGRAVHTLTLHEIEGYARAHAPGASTWNHLRIALVGLFGHAQKRGWCEDNPASKLEPVSIDHGMPTVFSPGDVRKLLAAAEKTDPRMLPHYVVGIFCGLRPENELRSLTWDRISLAEGFVRVEAATSKTRRRRDVVLAPNAVAWLRAHGQAEGRVFYSRTRHREIVEAAGVAWSKDIMRHTFGSYLLARDGDLGRVATQMGNSVPIVQAHYLNLRTKAEAAQFWSIAPSHVGGKVVPLRTACA